MLTNRFVTIISTIIVMSATVVGCGRVETGEVGVRTTFNKKVELNEVPQGFYFAVFSSVDHFAVKEIGIEMNDLTPKAKDNLSLKDFDLVVYYTTNEDKVAELLIERQNQHVWDPDARNYMPGFKLVSALARGAAYDAIAQHDSLTIHSNRSVIEHEVRRRIQEDLDAAVPGTFTITRVVVRQVLTDPSIEESIRRSVAVDKEVEAKNKEVALATAEARRKIEEAKGIAEYNERIAASLSPNLLQYKALEVQEQFAGQGTHTVIMPQNTGALVSIGK